MHKAITQSKQKKIKGSRPKLKVFRSSEPLKSVLMWGINYSHNALQHVRPHAVFVKDDFKSSIKIKVSNHNFDRENMPSRYKFKEYAPMVFQNIRKKFGISQEEYLESFTQSEPEWDLTVGRSGSKFMVSYNRHFVIKTIHSEDLIQLHSILENYYAYIVQCNGSTILPQYLGLYRISVSDQETYLLVMRNVFSPRLTIHSKYDLKGTHLDREANEKEKSKPMPTLKDMDFINEMSQIHVGAAAKSELMAKLEKDIQFLQDSNLTDYSILVGVHDLDNPGPSEQVATIQAEHTLSDPEDVNGRKYSQPDISRDLNQLTNLPGSTGYVSAGDGMGTLIEMLKRKGISTNPDPGPACVGFPGLPTASTSADPNANHRPGEDRRVSGHKLFSSRSQTTDDDEEVLSDPASMPKSHPISMTARSPSQDVDLSSSDPHKGAGLGHLTPPESPPNDAFLASIFTGQINRSLEFYGFPSEPGATPRCIYFIALIDILNQYGLKKKTAKTYKSVTGHNTEVHNMKPEQYGSRLYEFINNHVV